MDILMEYIIVFIALIILNIFIYRFSSEMIRPQLVYLKKIYKVSIRKDEIKEFTSLIIFINSFIIDTIYIIVLYLISNWVIRVIVGIVLLILLIIICYGLLGRYYRKKEN